eukprot:2862612-Rhodomonas_salina.2
MKLEAVFEQDVGVRYCMRGKPGARSVLDGSHTPDSPLHTPPQYQVSHSTHADCETHRVQKPKFTFLVLVFPESWSYHVLVIGVWVDNVTCAAISALGCCPKALGWSKTALCQYRASHSAHDAGHN